MQDLEKRDLYSGTDTKNMTEDEKYKYYTTNDSDILIYKEDVRKIVEKKGLGSYMNDTKWLRLQKLVANLPFSPSYYEKLIRDDNFNFSKIVKIKNSTCFGNWSPFYMEGMSLFFSIEYIIVIPVYIEYVGRLVKGKVIDITAELEKLLLDNNIPFEFNNGNFVIYGYK
ncbi:DUF6678 family protein [Flavobacterium ardleyense]|uniref:DUF6678 family protein n=1 Tax=Flavobacterium ardleyense TaxID=2038737 RepID=A0ABW5Z4I8_9FLAO